MKSNTPDDQLCETHALGAGAAHDTGYKPTKEFLRYLILAQSAQAEGHESKWRAVNEQRDEVTKIIARRPARNLGDVFEKLYIWRIESFDPSDEDFIYFDDLFPLSAYYDIKELVGFDGATLELDEFYEGLLRGCKSRADEKEEAEENNIVPLFRS